MTHVDVRFPYQDATLPVDQRVEDLLARMDVKDKAGLLFQPMAQIGDFDEPGLFGKLPLRSLLERRINHFNILFVPSAREIAQWHNAVQEQALQYPLGIPVTISSDPRHSFTNNPAMALLAGPFSQWPEPLGLAAVGSEELVEQFADVTRREYLAVGIRTALHPQLDLATEPRWARTFGTFGADAGLVTRLGVAYVRGLQGEQVGPHSVSAMAKHFPGGGPQKDGEDPHFPYGREQVYPGGHFDLHLEPFKAAIAAGVSQIMPYYGFPVGTDYEEVGFSFNKGIVTGLLREQLGFDGIVCTDWGILSHTYWGVEQLSHEERMIKALNAGIDQFGGEDDAYTLFTLIADGTVSEKRIDTSVRRLLREKFRLGLFEEPFVDAGQADTLVGGPEARAAGLAAQAAAHTLLRNAEDGPARLPLRGSPRLYVEGLSTAAIGDRAQVVDTPDQADVAVLRLVAPWEQRGEPGTYETFFHAGSLAFPAAEMARIRAICRTTPTVLDVYLERPAILADVADDAASLIANFGASEEAFVQVLFGEAEPQGQLPFDIPSSMAAVEASHSDAPFDTADPTFRFGFGLRYA
ncbi:glycoside hydrolase family 3 C-terminal domain-containing protein [Frankia sp. AgB1.9]|uniref:glycoside hydrolase family 3 protein n=1 Tax=unclassified Frankia TaxID=2632575 RepID=UPI0019338BDC|nr:MULTISPECIES: glycoside hydrolase family 3 N-terminal domain-containing protein [unclassified Frankia]MBL7487538.1 glycoside hydrolase family 3 C-terminal domain-containing protein [Frankia sp. AgW1.1]MBL7549509.1 glycoside hydrolase family 3 C-terminal domain-containing protein [Frankia sp. AgB1.9]MBL7620702.1 glycoside hydrolase family 3 C-terminal domain-containing protein [Frankia sp. AgB1.8]